METNLNGLGVLGILALVAVLVYGVHLLHARAERALNVRADAKRADSRGPGLDALGRACDAAAQVRKPELGPLGFDERTVTRYRHEEPRA